jgi:hypothetical protein
MASKLTSLTQQLSASQLQQRSGESAKWLLQKIAEIRNPSQIARGIKAEKDRQVINRFMKGCLYCFYYDAKTKETLPYWDKFPLVLVLEKYPDGFLGLNLHYLPIRQRAALMDKLMGFAVMREDDIMKMRVTYDILASTRRYREFQPCLKKYLYSHLKSKILAVQPNEWEVATFLPMQQFKGAKPKQVWQESLDQIKANNGRDD